MKPILYILYFWPDQKILTASFNKERVMAKIGEDAINGEIIDDYHIIEIDLDEVEK